MTNKSFFSVGTRFLLLAMLAGCTAAPGWQWAGGERLDPCTAKGGPFEKQEIEKWPETYHGTVSKIIDAHVKQLGNISKAEITCTAGDYPSMMKASPELQALASSLPPWKGKTVSELEMAPVLLEYLRVYECSLEERRYNVTTSPLQQSSATSSKDPSPAYGNYNDEVSDESKIINEEVASARQILERTLTIVGGLDRLRPLSMDVECISRSSIDLRNALGLTAEAASCMPRAWDVRGSLRDLTDLPPTE